MSDFTTMVSRIEREIVRDGMTADIKDSIVDAIKYYESDRFWFNELSATASTVTGGYMVTAPANTVEIDNINLIQSGGQVYTLDEVRLIEMERQQDQTAQPTTWAWFTDKLRLFPVPDAAYELRVIGFKRLPEISASASNAATNSWMTDAEAMIRARAKHYLFDGRLRNAREADRALLTAEREWRRLKAKTERRVGLGILAGHE